MAAVSLSRRALAGIVFIIAGALILLARILDLASMTDATPWLTALGYAGIVVALVILAFGAVNAMLTKIALIVSAVGWAVLALYVVKVDMPATVVIIAALFAGVAGLIAAAVLYAGKEVKNTPALLFIVTMVLGLLVVLPYMGVTALGGTGTIATVITALFAIGLVISGVLFRQKERR
jgi:hypothetical protein